MILNEEIEDVNRAENSILFHMNILKFVRSSHPDYGLIILVRKPVFLMNCL